MLVQPRKRWTPESNLAEDLVRSSKSNRSVSSSGSSNTLVIHSAKGKRAVAVTWVPSSGPICMISWLVVSTPLKNNSQLSVGLLFPIYGKIKSMFQSTKQFLSRETFGCQALHRHDGSNKPMPPSPMDPSRNLPPAAFCFQISSALQIQQRHWRRQCRPKRVLPCCGKDARSCRSRSCNTDTQHDQKLPLERQESQEWSWSSCLIGMRQLCDNLQLCSCSLPRVLAFVRPEPQLVLARGLSGLGTLWRL